MGEYADEKIKEKLKRLEFMDGDDILFMDLRFIPRLADFGNQELVRRIVAKGHSKLQKKQILEKLKEAYQRIFWYEYASLPEECGYTEEKPGYFYDIEFDIETNTPLLPDENSPLPASPEGEELGLGKGLLNSRIAELEKENEALKEQVEHFRNMEKGTALGLNQAQAALFGLSLANTFQFKYTNKKKQLAPLLHKLFGWGQTKLKTCLSTPCEKEERDELANLFKELCPPLYETIMKWGELPQ